MFLQGKRNYSDADSHKNTTVLVLNLVNNNINVTLNIIIVDSRGDANIIPQTIYRQCSYLFSIIKQLV